MGSVLSEKEHKGTLCVWVVVVVVIYLDLGGGDITTWVCQNAQRQGKILLHANYNSMNIGEEREDESKLNTDWGPKRTLKSV